MVRLVVGIAPSYTHERARTDVINGRKARKFRAPQPLVFLIFAGIVLLCAAGQVLADDGCQNCNEDRFPEASAFLEAQGYPADSYDLLLSWRERGRTLATGTITGYRLAPVGGGEPFDLYSDASGRLLSSSEAEQAGIKNKSWDLPPAEQLPEISERVSKHTQPKPRALGPLKGARPGKWVLLEPVDLGKVLAEDLEREEQAVKSAKRIGVFQKFPRNLFVNGEYASEGEWQTFPDGTRLWSVRIYSPEAVAQRVHFTTLDLPRGAEVIVYNASYPEEAYGPYTAIHPGDGDLWAASCFSDTIAVECIVPHGVSIQPVRISIDQVAHIYVDFAKLQWTKALNDAGACNLDVACYDDWQETSWGVGGIGTIGSTGVLWCTGSLIADSVAETNIPYFLTAEHCVGTALEANSIEVYWLWQRETCGGVLPPVYAVPRTGGGADLMVSAEAPTLFPGGSDFALLRLRNQPPAEITYLGWTTGPPPLGTSITCIHHPRGDYKRISFGDTIEGAAYSTVHRVGWNEGTTERGSSGSPLMLADTQQIIGQLWRGTASCTMPRELGGWDEFGRFDVTYTLAKAWLGPIEPAGPADVNKDGFLDAVDVQLVINAALGIPINPEYEPNVDSDPGGLVNAVDVQLVINAALGM